MNEQTAELLNKLSDKLGVATEVLWGALLRQALISSISSITMGVIFYAILSLGFRWASKIKDDEFSLFVRGVIVMVGFFSLVIVCLEIPSIMAGLFNPEYWALKEILRSL